MHLKRNAFHTENSSGLSVVTVIGIDPGSRLMGWGIVSDRSGQLKLIEYSYTGTDGTTVTTVRPCPVHYLGTEPDADFSSILKVKVKEPHDTQYFFY